jgi:hypothetical protein
MGKEAILEVLMEDPEAIAQLDWLWSNRLNSTKSETGPSLVELSQQVDKGCVKEDSNILKPIER